MFDMESRHIIEALRSGIPSRAVGQYFSEARHKIMDDVTGRIEKVARTGKSSGMVFSGKYGEGKTHLLNSVFNIASQNNMVVSYISISKETPFDKQHILYQKIMANTYLPGHQQPGIAQELEKLTTNSPAGSEMLLYSAKNLETDKLYYLLRSYMGTEDQEERFLLQADLEGDFIANGLLKKTYKRIFSETAKYNVNFSKTKHSMDYFNFMSHLFVTLGYNGWVILVDEAELIGRFSKKARINSYKNMAEFLMPQEKQQSTFTVFALSASYNEDVIEAKHELDNLDEIYPDNQEPMASVIKMLSDAPQLMPLTHSELIRVMEKVIDFHGRAYDWYPTLSAEELLKASSSSGYLLRTKLRTAIEYLDQVYQYGSSEEVTVGNLDVEDLSKEDEEISLD